MKVLITVMVFLGQLTFAQKTEVRQLDRFTALRVTSGIDVKLIRGDRPSARIESSGIRLDEIDTEVQGNTLRIGFKSIRIDGRNDVKIQVTYVSLDRITALAAASVYASEPVVSDGLELSASAAGSIEIPVKAERLSVEANAASSVILSGKAVQFHAEASTSSTVDAYQLEAQRVTVRVSTASDARVTARKEIDAEASTAGSIRYKGDPERSNTSATTAGSIRRVD